MSEPPDLSAEAPAGVGSYGGFQADVRTAGKEGEDAVVAEKEAACQAILRAVEQKAAHEQNREQAWGGD